MDWIHSKFGPGLLCALLLSSSAVYAEDKDSLIKSPVHERLPIPVAKPPPSSPATQPPPPTAVRQASNPGSLPDLVITEYALKPKPPSQREIVHVRIGVYNQGGAKAGAFTVEWWPGDNYPKPGCTWRVEGLVPNGGRILQCSGYVYPSWYRRINTGVYVDSGGEVEEISTRNNKLYKEVPVTQ